jgi:anaerobic magnesium-protoporphyrin IX monomethyl ester cyclase
MNIVLIQPYLSRDALFSIGIKNFAKVRGKYPPLGLAYIASILRENGHQVSIIDSEAEELGIDRLSKKVSDINPDVIGITGTDQTFIAVRDTARQLNELMPKVPIVLGGPVVAVYEDIILANNPWFDYAVIGEGENTINKLLDALGNIEELKKIDGIIYRVNGQCKINAASGYIENLDSVPFPAWDLLDMDKYNDILSKHSKYSIMIASRGCPFKCTFCDPLGRLGKKFRFRSAANIVAEMELLKKDYGVEEVAFYDDTFTVNKKKIDELCDILIKKNINMEWECRTRVDLVDEELLRRMHNAGCVRIRFGIESSNQKSLNFIKKGITLDQAKSAIVLCKKLKIETVAYYMLGIPGEIEADVLNTIRFAKELNTTYANFSATAFTNPKSEMFKWGAERGLISSTYWEDLVMGKEVGECYVSTRELPSEKVLEYVKKASLLFYLRPRKILPLVIHIYKSPVHISNYVRLFFNMIGRNRGNN